ncbi:SDR family NAD(P)-dependent oxidoreductase [Pseudonocardia bannensis]|uniref:SDR family NAD(P)-dependent oxidoreductase n=1 Tax=Pseudonocardia bannensis TaxID=630973 RepID=A0A848DF30_9PSEU|nr:SDR family NAD(P)-dependent oxidoreductase [Pseudonocardia bannensis]NMH91217.1 SDR family NAD(P)-dependent oxidoreductase [Pseudonocardia bannensis]
MRRFDGKIAVIAGAGRGQGRSHAVRPASKGADVVALDIGHDIDSVAYDLATRADLDETARPVREQGRRVVTAEVDVRDADTLTSGVTDAAGQLGGVDIVLANAGIGIVKPGTDPARAFRDQLDVNLVGVWNTVHATAPLMIEQGRGGAAVPTSSAFGLAGRGGDPHGPQPGRRGAVRRGDEPAPDPQPTEGVAHLLDVALVEVSSGDVVRHRLSRAGDRQLNCCLHTMAISQVQRDCPGRDYYLRKRAAGKGRKEALRCLKRRLSVVVYRRLLCDATQQEGASPGGHQGATTESSAAGSTPTTGSSDKSLPGLANPDPTTPNQDRLD